MKLHVVIFPTDEAEVKLPMIDKSYSLEKKLIESTEPLLKEVCVLLEANFPTL